MEMLSQLLVKTNHPTDSLTAFANLGDPMASLAEKLSASRPTWWKPESLQLPAIDELIALLYEGNETPSKHSVGAGRLIAEYCGNREARPVMAFTSHGQGHIDLAMSGFEALGNAKRAAPVQEFLARQLQFGEVRVVADYRLEFHAQFPVPRPTAGPRAYLGEICEDSIYALKWMRMAGTLAPAGTGA